jgi:hypothetical protein
MIVKLFRIEIINKNQFKQFIMKPIFSTRARFLKATLLVALALSMTNCSKDDDPAPVANPEVNPLSAYLTATAFNEQTTNQVNLSDYEFGLSFIPNVNGKITALIVKIPDVNPTLRMTIWNKTTATVLKTETINYATAGVEVTKAIDALNVTAGTEYFVTFNSNDWYDRRRTNSTNATYPVLVGDINITSYSFRSGTAQAMPNSPQLSYYAGDISFLFQKS